MLLYGLFWLPPVQRTVADAALRGVMEKTHNKLSIGSLRLRPFNRLQLENVFVGDLQGDTLLYVGRLSVGFSLPRLLKRQLFIRSIHLQDFVIQVEKENPDADPNFRFLLDAFASPAPDTTAAGLNFRIQDLGLSNGRIAYHVRSEPFMPDGVFDRNHICLSNIHAALDVRTDDGNRARIRIHALSFSENNNLNVKRLQANLQTEGARYSLTDARLQVAHSQLTVSSAHYDSGDFSIAWEDTRFHLPDLQAFFPLPAALSGNVALAGELHGVYPQVELTGFKAVYDDLLHLELQASIDDCERWQHAPFRLQARATSNKADTVFHLLAGYQPLPFRVGKLALDASLQGSLSDLILNLNLESADGRLQLEGGAGYATETGDAHFDASLHSQGFNLASLLRDDRLGAASWEVQAWGRIPANGALDLRAEARIDRFDFNNYPYHGLWAEAAYWGDSVRLDLRSDDAHVPLQLALYGVLGNDPRLTLDAALERVSLDTLHVTPRYREAFLSAKVRAEVLGFDPENMQAGLALDSLELLTDGGSLSEPQLRLSYTADGAGRKTLDFRSHLGDIRAGGNFTYKGLHATLLENFPAFFPSVRPLPARNDRPAEDFDFRVRMNNLQEASALLDLPQALPDSILILGKYANDGSRMRLTASAYARFMESDTLQLSLSLSNKNQGLAAVFNVDNKSANYNIDGSLDAEIAFAPPRPGSIPDINIAFNPTIWVLNEAAFRFQPAQLEIQMQEGRYRLHNLKIEHSDHPDEYLAADGTVSALESDSLALDVSHFQLSTLFDAVKTNLPLAGSIGGRITARSLLATPVVQTEDFAVREITFDGSAVGDLHIGLDWNTDTFGLALTAALGRAGQPPSTLQGIILPDEDSLDVQARLRDIQLQWFQKMLAGSLYGLSGSLGADVRISGKLSDPSVDGTLRVDHAQAGLTLLNTLYSINDSISFNSKNINLKNFVVSDENKNALIATGTISHDRFSGFTPKINLVLNDFLVLNNERQVDSLFYGNLRINGLLAVKPSGKAWVISGDLTHSNNARFTVNLPSTASSAERYSRMVTYLVAESESNRPPARNTPQETGTVAIDLPLRINASLWFDPSLTIGAVFNPLTGDAVHARGNGMIRLAYNPAASTLSLLGDYEISTGSVNFSLANITQRTFAIQEGGKLIFHGDPLQTTFNLTAAYNLRADLKTLDQSFGELGIVGAKVPVSCLLAASGNIERMTLDYNIRLPNESDNIQRKLDGLLYTDDLKIKQITYLLALGSFMPASNDSPDQGNPILINSLSAITSGSLNKLLAGVLNEKWSVHTDLQTDDKGLNDMAVNVSGSMLDDRLTINGTVGYHNTATQTNSFTGDFDVEYKLIPSGNLILKAYNVTNNQYYERAATTQGVGVAYKREARTFRKLFDKFKKK